MSALLIGCVVFRSVLRVRLILRLQGMYLQSPQKITCLRTPALSKLRQRVLPGSAVHHDVWARAGRASFESSATASYETINSDVEGAAGIITISKPKALNALSSQASTCCHRH